VAYLNYTTSIEVGKTIGEITGILVQAGAQKILIDYKDKQPSAISFKINSKEGEFSVILPAKPANVLQILKKQKAEMGSRMKTKADYEQACRVAWRIIKGWLEAQIAMIEADQAELPEIFLAQLLDTRTNQSFYQVMKENNFLLPEGRG
jgi:hypothetical protein